MRERVRIGVIGCGMVGQAAHLVHYRADPDCDVVAVADLRPELAARVAARFEVPRVYGSHQALLEDPAIDAVVVVTRPAASGAIVLDALGAGRHVFSEKPMAHTLLDATRLARAAQAATRSYAVGFMKRYDPCVTCMKATLHEHLRGGLLGALTHVHAYSLHGLTGTFPASAYAMSSETRPDGLATWPVAPGWLPAALHRNFAAFLNVHVHMLNLLRFVFEEQPAVRSADLLAPLARTASLRVRGVPLLLEMRDTARAPWREGIAVHFEAGSIELELPPPFQPNARGRVSVRDEHGARNLPFEHEWAFAAQARAFAHAIRTGGQPRACGADGVADLELAEELWRFHAD